MEEDFCRRAIARSDSGEHSRIYLSGSSLLDVKNPSNVNLGGEMENTRF
jgi:hypothetical protein